jgi:gamma-glutamyltranspeptidase/glutathione hydrolase
MKNTLLLTVLIPVLVFGADRLTGRSFTTRSEVIAKNGMAASDHPFVSQAAIEILKQGGNAIDAAIAANAVQSVVEPGENGIGGDLFAMIWHAKSNKLYGINGSGRSSKSRSLAYLKDTLKLTQGPNIGGIAVTVPGCVASWFDMHERFGSLPMKKILSRAIHYARAGFPVTDQIGHKWRTRLAERKAMGQTALWKLYTINGKPPEKGEIFKNPALAKTFDLLAKKGRKPFYKGRIATSIVEAVQKAGGILTLDDLKSHTSNWIEPVSTRYRGYDVWALPPNGHGIAVLQILNLLEPYDIKGMGFGSAEYIHCFVEAKKLVYEDRAKFYADIDVGKVPVKALISKAYADKRRKLINENEAAQNVAPGDPFSNNSETIYITVADKEGNMVSLIQSKLLCAGKKAVAQYHSGVCHPKGKTLYQLRCDVRGYAAAGAGADFSKHH